MSFNKEDALIEIKILEESIKINVSIVLKDLERLRQRFSRSQSNISDINGTEF